MQILNLIKDILPHVAALNQLQNSKKSLSPEKRISANGGGGDNGNNMDATNNSNVLTTTSNHYCLVESEHPYRSPSLTCYRVEFPPCVQWLTLEFDEQCGTAQLEDALLISVPMKQVANVQPCLDTAPEFHDILDNNVKSAKGLCRNAALITSCYNSPMDLCEQELLTDSDWIMAKKFNT